MAEIEDQIRAWADAAAPAEGALAPSATRPWFRRRHRAVLAAAVVVAVAAGVWAVSSGDGGPDHVRTAGTTTESSRPASASTPTAVDYHELAEVGGNHQTALTVVSASTQAQLDGLWSSFDAGPKVPEVDLDHRVVVGVVLPPGCPRRLEGLRRTGDVVVPQFGEPTPRCPAGIRPGWLLAIDRATAGERFWFEVPEGLLDGSSGDDARHRILVDAARPAQVLVDVRPGRGVVAPGGQLTGVVTVSNATGSPIRASHCGAPFGISLHGERAEQAFAQPDCLQTVEVPPGTSTFQVSTEADTRACTTDPGAGPRCDADGSPPDLPPGTYEVEVHQPGGLDGATPEPPATVRVR